MIHNDSKNLYKNIINGISKNILKCINEAQIDLLSDTEKNILNNKDFQNWFKNSKCVDEDNITPLVLFYGGEIGSANNYWFSDSNIVAKYFGADNRNRFRKTHFHKAFIKMVNPLIIDWEYDAWSVHYDDNDNIVDTETMAITAKEKGYDGLIIKNVYEGENEQYLCDDYVVFDDKQIYWIK